ncbi:MAG: MFS transporter, partial [Chloroflexi bacterium]|nr:MFS transporter [Chloroflexota bacterium]
MSNPAGKIRARRLYYGWLVVMTVGLAGFAQSPGTFPVLSVLLTPITEEFHWNRTVFAGATSTGSILGGVVAFLLGAVLDRFGPRWIMTGALLVLGGALLLLSLISALWQFYLLIILTRVATMGVLGLALGVVVPKWFVVKRGRAVALSGIGGVAGGSITPLYVGMVAEMISWRAAAATAGLVVWAVALLPSILFLRRRPEDMGLLPDGLSQEELRHIQTPGQNAASTRARTEVSYTLRQVLRFRSFYLLVAAFTLLLVVMPGMVLHMVAYL